MVENLQRQAYYAFGVTAKTRFGWGETASVDVYTMENRSHPDSPSKPTIKSSQINARNVTISWRIPPFHGYGPIRNFTMQCKLGDSMWNTVPEAVVSTTTTYMYTITRLRPNSVYMFRVAATNDVGQSPYGEQSDPITTLQDSPDGVPSSVVAKALTQTSAVVSWEQPLPETWNGAITGYVVNYKYISYHSYQEEIVNHTGSQVVVENLKMFENYEFIVTAYNSIGKGPGSKPVWLFTGEAAPTAAPLDIRTESVKSTGIRIFWSPPPPDTQNGQLSGYRVYCWLATEPESTAKQNITREQSILIRDLQIYTDYAIVVQAFNLAGDGPKSSVTYQTSMEGLPGKPARISFWNVTYDSLDVSWMPPLQPNGIITKYQLTYVEKSPAGGSKMVTYDDLNGTQSSMHIDDLSQQFTYVFSVYASTSVGYGEGITKSVVTGPQEGSPGRPERPDVQNVVDGQLTVLWAEGSAGDYPTYRYILETRANDINRWDRIMETSGQEIQVDISFLSLNPGSEYQFRVAALNVIGISEYSEPSLPFDIIVTTQITRPPQNQTVIKSVTALLQCGVLHDPDIVVTWTWFFRPVHQEHIQRIIPDGQKRILNSDGTLIIFDTNEGDIGDYTCNVASHAGNDSKTATLGIKVTTQITRPPQNQTVTKSTLAVLQCGVLHDPDIVVTWTWSFRPVHQEHFQRIIPDGQKIILISDGTLIIFDTNEGDIGDYTCNVASHAGNDSKTATLAIRVTTRITRPPQNQTVTKSTTAVLQCGVLHDPDIVVTWTWSFRPVHEEHFHRIIPDRQKRILNSYGTLIIFDTNDGDIGDYTCNVASRAGNDSKTATLAIRVTTRITRPPPNQTVDKSTTVVLPCGVSHDKDVAVTWTWSFSPVNQKQLQIIIPDGLKRILDSDGTLRITDTHEGDVGNYTCNVISRAGNDYVMATLMVNEHLANDNRTNNADALTPAISLCFLFPFCLTYVSCFKGVAN